MPEDRLESALKDILGNYQKDNTAGSPDCLSDEELAEYASSVLSDEVPRGNWQNHINECEACFSKIASCIATLRSEKVSFSDTPKPAALQKAKSIAERLKRPKSTKGYLRRNLSLFITAGFFMLSFVVKRYFLQFLCAAVIFGFKWVMDTGGSKALIMIYDAWQSKKSAEEGRTRKDKLNTRI